ncbi:MAG TPA: two-component system activity regulator YycH, partial [Oscillospiraceae bacterium]|nr:two-component system activity regulator YycH [Oscillospiraceae bacterium]
MNRERLKTLTLFILVVMSIVLIQQLWFPFLIDTFRAGVKVGKNNHTTVIEERKNIISPKIIAVSFGAGDKKRNYYTILSSDIDLVWKQSRDILESYFLGQPEITPVEYNVYTQANTLKSIELEFGNNIPSILISSIFDSLDNRIVKNVKEIKKILIPAFNRGVIYIMESSNDIYEVKLYDYENNTVLIDFIDKLESSEHIKYYPAASLFDELDGNHTVLPVNYTLSAKQIFVESEIDVKDETVLRQRSRNFFGDNFDFVKTIKETGGATVYIYGYGEKRLRINNRGILEYKEEVGNVSSTDILISLDAAVGFICENGGFPENTYLENIQIVEDGQNKGYRFLFGYCIEGFPVEFNINKPKYPMEIEVYGNRVKAYDSLIRKTMNMQDVDIEQKILYFPNIIENNIKHLG